MDQSKIAAAMTADVTLKEYFERVFDEKEKALQLAFKAQQEALAIATTALNRELEHLNNLRQEINQNRSEYMLRTESTTAMRAVEDKIAMLENRMDKSTGQGAGLSLAWQIMLGVIAIASALALFWQAWHTH